MTVAASELGVRHEPSGAITGPSSFFPDFRNFIRRGTLVEENVVELLTAEEITWLRRARASVLHGEEICPPESVNTYPHLIGFSLHEPEQPR